MAEASDLTPPEWLTRLGRKWQDRQQPIAYWQRYYEGQHDLPAGPNQHREVFQRFQRLSRTNLCFLAAESRVHRTRAIGFSDPQWKSLDEIDPVWRLWQQAKLDGRQFRIWRMVYSLGAAYVTVGVDPYASKKPRVTIESPKNVIVECDPADESRRLAALRTWHDPIVKKWMATLYLRGDRDDQPGTRYAWETRNTTGFGAIAGGLSWKENAWVSRHDPEPTLPGVPVVPFRHGDDEDDPHPVFATGIDDQNRLNLTLLNRLSSERYAAFRQQILLNWDIEEDPVTGQPIAPYKPGVDQIGMLAPPSEPGDPPVQLVQTQQTDTSNMLRAVEGDMRAFASTTLTPVYYLPGDMSNLGADTVAALDAGHNAAIAQALAGFAEGAEEVLGLMARVAELDRDLSQSEIAFARPENFNPAAVGDVASKLSAAGFPLPMVAEEIGWSPQKVNRLRSEMAATALRAAITGPAAPAGQQQPTGQPAGQQPAAEPAAKPATEPPPAPVGRV